MKGVDEGLETNLESFFGLDYPDYELLLCVANAEDPAIEVANRVLARHPGTNAKLLIGERVVGPNPKINNLVPAYEQAAHDWILISDSNVRATHDYLRTVTAKFEPDVGIVTAVVAGTDPRAIGGWLESVFLNTFYARWMILSRCLGQPVVVGKSMLFRKTDARRFGGLIVLGRYLAEDYMAGQAMKLLGRRVEIMVTPVRQPLGRHSLGAFWSRHLRWGRIRKSQAPPVFAIEPALSFWGSGLAGSFAMSHFFHVSAFLVFSLHTALWLAADLWVLRLVAPRIILRHPFRVTLAWFARETLHLPLWMHIAAGHTVLWRGNRLELARGGVLKKTKGAA